MSFLKEVGAYAGLAAFFGLAVLALLYFAQARDVRRLRENASFLVEGGDGQATEAARAPAAVAAEPEQAAAAAAATAPSDVEAFRRAELARQAAERRQRFEQRRRPGPGGGRPGWLSETPSTALIAVGAVLLVAGLIFAGTRIFGGDESSTATKGAKNSPCPPAQTQVAVLNGTATGGLAAQFAKPLKEAGYKTTPITNTESPVDTSQVMFDPQAGQACAPVIAGIVAIRNTAPMTNEIRGIAGGDPVAVVLGEDQAGGATSSSAGTTGQSSTGL
jgi:hypothetical protein